MPHQCLPKQQLSHKLEYKDSSENKKNSHTQKMPIKLNSHENEYAMNPALLGGLVRGSTSASTITRITQKSGLVEQQQVFPTSGPVKKKLEPKFLVENGQGDNEDTDDDLLEHCKDKKNGRRKIKIEFITDRSKRHITFSKRKSGIMKKAYELSTLTGTQVMLLVASETGHVYTFATSRFQPMVVKPEGRAIIQQCLGDPEQCFEQLLQSENTATEEGKNIFNYEQDPQNLFVVGESFPTDTDPFPVQSQPFCNSSALKNHQRSDSFWSCHTDISRNCSTPDDRSSDPYGLRVLSK